jgi:Fic family protein
VATFSYKVFLVFLITIITSNFELINGFIRIMTQWIWQQPNWPHFYWDDSQLMTRLAETSYLQGRLAAIAEQLSQTQQQETLAEVLIDDVIKTSAIEGEMLPLAKVRSSVARRLGIPQAGFEPPMENEGIVDITLDALQHQQQPLTLERLCGWHAALFPTGYSGLHKILVGQLRGEAPMQVVSGPIGKERLHFEAPPRQGLEKELNAFLTWFNPSLATTQGFIRAAVAHLWFITLHPFEDGNGRLARTITDLGLAQSEPQALRLYSMSREIQRQREDYYTILEETQRGGLEITEWLAWFLQCLSGAMRESENLIQQILQKALFWHFHSQTVLNARQCKILNRLLDAGAEGFEGGMNTRKYASLGRVSKATASRELIDLLNKGCLVKKPGGGRSTAYEIKWVKKRID